MTIPQYSTLPPQRRLSKSSLCSFIFGLLFCLPILGGALAILFGIIGFIKTRNVALSGRWMAIVGTLLGFANICICLLFGGFIWAIFAGTAGPRIAAHDFLREVSLSNNASAKALTAGMTDADYDEIAATVRARGKFVDTTFYSTSINNSSARVNGTITFDAGRADVTADLEKLGTWKVRRIYIDPAR